MLTGVLRRLDLAFDATLAETARDHDAVQLADRAGLEVTGHVLRRHPVDLHVGAVERSRVVQRFDDRQVGVGQSDVLADDADTNRERRILHSLDQVAPLAEVRFGVGQAQQSAHFGVEAFVVQHERDVVEARCVRRVDDRLDGNVAQRRDLLLEARIDGALAATHDDVRLNAPAPQLGHRVLGGLRLLLVSRADERHERQVDVADVLAAHVEAELPDRFEERQDLDVADRSADLGDDDVDVVGGEIRHPSLDLVGHVRDDLHGLAQVIATPLRSEHRCVDRTRRGVGPAGQVLVDEPLVVPKVEVGLATVLGDVHLAMLEGVHRAGVDVDVGVELLHRHPKATRLEQTSE